ncbi:M15 family metallopeptidase [Promicromonospora iranensis]|uniref:LAS superfamily LD-carboxypeptidase LdcB n=1 Tax=Promicromonospora iranensis TaxID=1105144 RepID=A0ABU2CNR3_9MICO|nr:M15 family metallopeptidase [Promicromonospora iranensis]MDR7382984.1 LAS superfamily LD-carboxypeptidase LdcB [Promicromonospora iranensis]
MTSGDHALVPRRTRRPGTRGAHAAVIERSPHPLVRRSSLAIAAALTSVALTATAAVSLTGNDGASASTPAATERGTAPNAMALGGMTDADPAVRAAAAKANAVLTDADYMTREGDLGGKERKRLGAAAQKLRSTLEQARDASGTTIAGVRQAPAASRDGARAPLAERAADSSARDAVAKETTEADPGAAATAPTNLAGAVTGVTPVSEQAATELPILETPLADAVDMTADAQGPSSEAATETSAAAASPSAASIEKATTSLQRLLTRADGDAVVSVKAGPTPEEIKAAKKAAVKAREARAARAAERAAVEAREKAAARVAEAKEMTRAAKRYGNGEIPSDVLCGLSWAGGEQLRCDAAAELETLNGAFRAAFGRNLDVTDGYRSYAEQLAVAASKGGLAAVPGTSNHGWGQAVDLSGGVQSFGTAEHAWMVAHAGKYGWKLPTWAQAGGSKPEAWHWEYRTSY